MLGTGFRRHTQTAKGGCFRTIRTTPKPAPDVYKNIKEVAFGKEMMCERKPKNVYNKDAIRVKKDGFVVKLITFRTSSLQVKSLAA